MQIRRTVLTSLIAVAIALGTCDLAIALVLCTTPDGKTYLGDDPPHGCAEKPSAPVRQPTPARNPLADEHAHERLLSAGKRNAEIDRRRLVPALAVQPVMNRV